MVSVRKHPDQGNYMPVHLWFFYNRGVRRCSAPHGAWLHPPLAAAWPHALRGGGISITADDFLQRGHVLLDHADEGELVAAAVEVVVGAAGFEIDVALEVVG